MNTQQLIEQHEAAIKTLYKINENTSTKLDYERQLLLPVNHSERTFYTSAELRRKISERNAEITRLTKLHFEQQSKILSDLYNELNPKP